MNARLFTTLFLIGSITITVVAAPSSKQLENWLRRYPKADTNGDGRLTAEEAEAFRNQLQGQKSSKDSANKPTGAPHTFKVDPGWDAESFPDHAVSHQSPKQIKAVYEEVLNGKGKPVTSYEKPADGALRIVGTGHSFMAPGYRTFPLICEAAGFSQPLFTHTGGGIKGSTRYK